MTEFYKVTGEKMSRYQKIRNVLLTVIVTLALQCTFEVCLGGYVDSNLVNGLNKLCGAFTVLDYTDLLTAAAVFVMLKEVKKREAKTDVATLVLSVILSFLLIVCISFKKYDSAIFLWGNSFQILLSTFCVLGFAVLLYLVLRLVYFGLEPARRYSNPEDHRAAGLCRPQNCRIKQKSPGGCRGSLSLSCICWLL